MSNDRALGMSEEEWAAFRHDFVEAALRLILETPESLTDVMMLLLWSEGYTYEDMAEVYEVAPSTVMRRIESASAKFSDIMSEK